MRRLIFLYPKRPGSGKLRAHDYIRGHDRAETLLLPEALEDYLTPENPVRFLDAFVAQLDLKAAGVAHVARPETGRPPYEREPLRVTSLGACCSNRDGHAPVSLMNF